MSNKITRTTTSKIGTYQKPLLVDILNPGKKSQIFNSKIGEKYYLAKTVFERGDTRLVKCADKNCQWTGRVKYTGSLTKKEYHRRSYYKDVKNFEFRRCNLQKAHSCTPETTDTKITLQGIRSEFYETGDNHYKRQNELIAKMLETIRIHPTKTIREKPKTQNSHEPEQIIVIH